MPFPLYVCLLRRPGCYAPSDGVNCRAAECIPALPRSAALRRGNYIAADYNCLRLYLGMN